MSSYSTKTNTADGPLIPFGPITNDPRTQQLIPKTFERLIHNDELSLDVTISCAFTGDKIRLVGLHVAGEEITPRLLGQLKIPAMIYFSAGDVIPNSYQWRVFVQSVSEMDSARRTGPTDEKLFDVAQAYWYNHVTWDNPRQRLMETWGISRTTANDWIRKASKLYPMPGRPTGKA